MLCLVLVYGYALTKQTQQQATEEKQKKEIIKNIRSIWYGVEVLWIRVWVDFRKSSFVFMGLG